MPVPPTSRSCCSHDPSYSSPQDPLHSNAFHLFTVLSTGCLWSVPVPPTSRSCCSMTPVTSSPHPPSSTSRWMTPCPRCAGLTECLWFGPGLSTDGSTTVWRTDDGALRLAHLPVSALMAAQLFGTLMATQSFWRTDDGTLGLQLCLLCLKSSILSVCRSLSWVRALLC